MDFGFISATFFAFKPRIDFAYLQPMKKLFALTVIIALYSCQERIIPDEEDSMNGLWIVQKVVVGDEEMTPNGRWTRFNSDSTQTSGNGWKQHSIGTWEYDLADSTLRIVNSNGLHDPYEDFKVEWEGNTMSWERMEDGVNVRVELLRSQQLPMTYSDQLLGLWQVESSHGDDALMNLSGDLLFIRWDGRFMVNTQEDRIHGVYNVHGHRSELELIPYGDEHPRSFWSVDFVENRIHLSLLNSDSTFTRILQRTHNF
jgi:hypothetical protein